MILEKKQLTMSENKITMYNLYIVLEGKLYLNECIGSGQQCPNNSKDKCCAIHQELCVIQAKIKDEM